MVNYSGFGEIIASDIDLSSRLPHSYEKSTLKIATGQFHLPTMTPTNVYRAATQASVGFSDDGIYLSWGKYGEFKIDQNSNITYQKIDKETASMFLLSEVMGVASWQKGKFVLHAGAIALNGMAHIFAGEPGMGKSTSITALWQKGATLLSDDLVLIDFTEDTIECVPSIAEIKIWEESIEGLEIDKALLKRSFEGKRKFLLPTEIENNPYPISSINILSYEPLENFAALELLKYFPLPNQVLNPPQLKRHFKESLLLQQNCKINQLKPMNTFDELKKWANQFLKDNA